MKPYIPLVAISIIASLWGCIKIEITSAGKKPEDVKPLTTMKDDAAEGIPRYFTFSTDRPYRLECRILQSDFEAAEALLKEIDREGLQNREGHAFGLDRGDGNFLFSYWKCIYHAMQKTSRPVISRLADVFRRLKSENGLNDLQTAYAVVRFVQFMQYYIPPGIGIYSPGRVLLERGKGGPGEPPPGSASGWHGAGDCDTKSLLLVLLLQELGYDAVVFDSYRYHHAMAGVNVPGAEGAAIEHRGKSYYVIESTYPNWNIGQMPPQYTDLSFFLPINPGERIPPVDGTLSKISVELPGARDGEGPGEREPNNDRENADRTMLLTLDGFLSDTDTEDWFRLGGQEGYFSAFTIVHNDDCNFDFQVFSGPSVAATAQGTGQADTVSGNIPGQCHVRVFRVSGAGPYSVIISPGGAIEKEPNDDEGDATGVSEFTIFGQIDRNGDVDYYSLAGQEGYNATYTIYHGPGCDFDIEVINDGSSVGAATGSAPVDSLTAEHGGRVLVKVTGKRGTGWYLVRIGRNR